MKTEKTVEDYGMELNEHVLTEEEQEELAQESDEENAKRYYQCACKNGNALPTRMRLTINVSASMGIKQLLCWNKE